MRTVHLAWMATLALLAAPAQAVDLTGTQVLLQYDYTGQASIHDSFTVGPGVEMSCTGGGAGNANACSLLNAPTLQTLDFDADSVTYAYSGPGASFSLIDTNRVTISHTVPGLVIGGVLLSGTVAGFDASRVSFGAASVTVDMSGVAVADGNWLRLQLLPVPEPSMAVLLSAGLLLGWGWQRHRPRA